MINEYKRLFNNHGYDPASLGCPKGRQFLRFDALTEDCKNGERILDFGCGFADLLDYFKSKKLKVDYTGFDVMAEFLDVARNRHPKGNFIKGEVGDVPTGIVFDRIICSGVFNYNYNPSNPGKHFDSICNILSQLFEITKKSLSVDFQTEYVDYRLENSYHQSLSEIGQFVTKMSRRFVIDHSYMPYEYCIIIRKDSSINEVDNTFLI